MKSKVSDIKSNGHSKAHLKKLRRKEMAGFEDAFLLQKELLLTRDYAEAIIEAVPPLLVLDQKLRVQTANESFCKSFKTSLRQTLHRKVYELGNGQWNIPELRTLLQAVLPRKKSFKNFEMTHEFKTIGTRTLLLSGRQVDHIQKILLVIEDITERRAEQAGIRTSETRYRRLFEAARDGILILDPQTRKITDANPFMSELLGYSHKELLGKELWQIGLLKDERASRSAFRQLQKNHFIRYEDLPLQTKRGRCHEVEFVSNLYQENGHQVIQCNIRDITARKKTEGALRESEERYRSLFNSIDEGFCVIEMLFDHKNKPVDYRFRFRTRQRQQLLDSIKKGLIMTTILQVEDDSNDVFFFQRAMKKAGALNPIRVAPDGQRAIDYLQGAGKFADRARFPLPGLVLLDLKLPHVMGLDVLKWIRQESGLPLVVVALTASANDNDIAAAYRLGTNGFLVKPSDAAKLEDIVKSIHQFWLIHNSLPLEISRESLPQACSATPAAPGLKIDVQSAKGRPAAARPKYQTDRAAGL